jgi:hypothetical protein
MLHVLAQVSSECPVRMSSQSFDLVVEYDKALTDECLNEVSGTVNVVAFLVREPVAGQVVRGSSRWEK